jgi:hypothetical protein
MDDTPTIRRTLIVALVRNHVDRLDLAKLRALYTTHTLTQDEIVFFLECVGIKLHLLGAAQGGAQGAEHLRMALSLCQQLGLEPGALTRGHQKPAGFGG